MNRRQFLKLSAGAVMWQFIPDMLPTVRAEDNQAHRTLVLIELKGGNDGLNMLVPYTEDRYYRLRPNLSVKRGEHLQLTESLGFNPQMQPLMETWKQNELAIIAGVGYPQPNRSHFRSIEIWETGSSSDEYIQSGWLARMIPTIPGASREIADGAVMGNDAGPLAGGGLRLVILRNLKQFFRQAEGLETLSVKTDNPALGHLITVQNDLNSTARALKQKLSRQQSVMQGFPKTQIGRQLETAAQLIAGDTELPVIKVSHGGFDTHANQRNVHNRLLKQLAEAMAAFRSAMVQSGHWNQVLVMTYSEFGRRPAENGSRGTDHGTAAPHFAMGGNVKGGIYGEQPSLINLENHDLRYSVDFRSLYSTVARRWWNFKTNSLAGGPFELIDFI